MVIDASSSSQEHHSWFIYISTQSTRDRENNRQEVGTFEFARETLF